MTAKKITDLPAASSVISTDLVPVVDSGATKKATVDQIGIAESTLARTLTNKTIAGASNTLTVRAASDITGTLPVANGGTGITSLGTGVATFLGTPSGANLAAALTTALPSSKGGTDVTSPGTSGNVLTSNGSAWTSAAVTSPSRLTALDSHHLHAWELDDASGNFVDTGASTSKVNLTANNTPIYATPGLLGNCAMFGISAAGAANTANASVLISSFTDLPVTGFTMEVWVQSFQQALKSIGGGDSNGADNFFVTGNGTTDAIAITARTAAPSSGFVNKATPASTQPGTPWAWHYIAVAYDGANVYVYVDGEILIKTASLVGNVDWSNGTTPKFSIANGQNSGGQFAGKMSRFRISDNVRSQSYLRGVYKTAMGF